MRPRDSDPTIAVALIVVAIVFAAGVLVGMAVHP